MGFSTLIARVREKKQRDKARKKENESSEKDGKKEPKSDVLYESDSWQLLLLQRLRDDASAYGS